MIESTLVDSKNEINTEKAKELGIFPCKVFCDGVEVERVTLFNQKDGYVKFENVIDGKVFVDGDKAIILESYIFGKVTYEKIK